MEIKANRVHQMTCMCKNCMDIMWKFSESLYDQFSDEKVLYYFDGPDLPPLRNNYVYSVTSTI
eukprot:8723211-Prorocentrum_lima.AAC.1